MKTCPQCKQIIKSSRTIRQNSFWWLCMTIIGNELGYTPEEMSLLIKDHFKWYSEVVNKKTGGVIKNYESSADWSKEVFTGRTETLIQFAAEHDIYIQTPKEFWGENC